MTTATVTSQATEWLRRRPAASYLGVSLRGLDGLVKQGVVRAYRLGGGVLLFDRAELDQAVRTGTRPSK